MLSTYVRKVPFLNKCCEKNGTRSVGTKTHAVTVLKTIKYEILYSLVRYTNFQSAFKVLENFFFRSLYSVCFTKRYTISITKTVCATLKRFYSLAVLKVYTGVKILNRIILKELSDLAIGA